MVVIVTIMILISEHFLSFIKVSLQEGSHIYIYILGMSGTLNTLHLYGFYLLNILLHNFKNDISIL